MSTNRGGTPKRLEKALYQETGSSCAVCREDDIHLLEVHHIMPFARVKRHDPANMIVLCVKCHAKAKSLEITPDQLYAFKAQLARRTVRAEGQPASQGSITSVTGVVAAGRDNIIGPGGVTIKFPKGTKAPKILIPGTVAEDKWKIGYLKYLRERLQKYVRWDLEKRGEAMNYGRFGATLRRELKFNLEELPLELFESAVAKLQRRIDNSRVGRSKKGKKLYRSFAEYKVTGPDASEIPAF